MSIDNERPMMSKIDVFATIESEEQAHALLEALADVLVAQGFYDPEVVKSLVALNAEPVPFDEEAWVEQGFHHYALIVMPGSGTHEELA